MRNRVLRFSPSFISQVELGQASPSIASLDRIASGLGVSLGQFFLASESMVPAVVQASHRPML
jgi:XRE family transcriptional regulator, regulator of sulfur utilization